MVLRVLLGALAISCVFAVQEDSGNEVAAAGGAGDADAAPPEREGARRLMTLQESLGLSDAEEQIIGKPWNYQQKFDPNNFFRSSQWAPTLYALPEGVCDLNDSHKQLIDQVDVWGGAAKTAPRIFCGVYTYHANHDTKIKAIKETWASRCDGFVAFSDQVDLAVPSFKIKHEGPEEWDNMWQKSRAIWKYIDRHYSNDFDWFVLGGDDIFLIVENLRKYLLSDDIKKAAGGFKDGGSVPMYLGRRFRPKGNNDRIFNSGGAAYLLNQKSVRLLASHLDDPSCNPHQKCSWEDVNVAACLRQHGVVAHDTRDGLGRERFHPFTPGQHLMYRVPKTNPEKDWYVDYSIDLKIGRECCSRNSLSFHYVDENLMRRLYHLVYSCPKAPVDLPHVDMAAGKA
ncbi:unnamed protein product [Ectocarpus sp. 4 AP-2014]